MKRIFGIPMFLIVLATQFIAIQPTAAEDWSSWKNWYGISWRGTAANHMKYAQQMGYEYIVVNIYNISQYRTLNDAYERPEARELNSI